MGTFNLTDQSNLFKTKFGKLSQNTYNSANVMLGRIKKEYDFTGEDMKVSVPTAFAGGVGSGSLPTANPGSYGKATILAKKVYSVTEIDRETIKASANDEGAFVNGLKHTVQKAVEAFNRNSSRILFGDGTGALGAGDGSTNVAGNGTTGTPYLVAIGSASWNEANWEENDYVNYDAETTELEIVAVDPTTRVVSLVGTSVGLAALSGAGPVPTNKFIHMQKSKDNDPLGLKAVCDATSGTLYNIAVARRWQATQQAAGGAGISTDRLNQLILDVQYKCGKVPKMIVTSFTQYRKILNLLEDQKQYVIDPRAKDLKGKISFKGVEYMSPAGPIGIFPERFCDADRVYAINDNFITCHHRPDFGWFDDDGTVFLRLATSDAYGARYGGYYQNYIVPSFQGVITGLAA